MKTVIEMAREADLIAQEGYQGTGWFWGRDNLERFAELVRADAIADEREACAVMAEKEAQYSLAAAIRARGEASIRGNT